MKITNNANLPQAFVRAVTPKYRSSIHSMGITSIIGPIRTRQIKLRYWDDITVDASSLVWACFGTATHEILKAGAENYGAEDECWFEQRFEVPSETPGVIIVGYIDLTHMNGIIDDYKTTSFWAVKDGMKPEWIRQLKGYAWLVNTAKGKGIIHKARVVALLKDWSKTNSMKYPDIPKSAICVLEDKQLTNLNAPEIMARTGRYLNDRVEAHTLANSMTDEELPMCTAEERWAKPDMWAVIKEGGKRAFRVLNNNEAAIKLADSKENHIVQYRPGENVRCATYCDCSKICKVIENSKIEKRRKAK